ncbi:MAG: flavin reductase [Pseudorhodoplanes sp.]|jgi:flavin reductase
MSWIDNSPVSVWEREQAAAATAEPGAPVAPPEMFREAMSRLGAAVHIITTSGAAGRAGFTATAVASVSDTPPTVLVCLNRKSQITPIMRENKVFCVNTLASSEEELANVFAGRTGVFMAERFMRGDWVKLETGAPVLTNAIAALDCRVLEMKSVATHDIYFGEVAAIRLANAEKALVYHARAYKHV